MVLGNSDTQVYPITWVIPPARTSLSGVAVLRPACVHTGWVFSMLPSTTALELFNVQVLLYYRVNRFTSWHSTHKASGAVSAFGTISVPVPSAIVAIE